jgi:hypothetical protein
MKPLDRRQVLTALAALGAGAAATPAAALPQVDPEGARRIGAAYLAIRPGLSAARLRSELLPDGWTPAAAARLKRRAAADFRAARVFVHRGWRLSETEGRLFALAALSS